MVSHTFMGFASTCYPVGKVAVVDFPVVPTMYRGDTKEMRHKCQWCGSLWIRIPDGGKCPNCDGLIGNHKVFV